MSSSSKTDVAREVPRRELRLGRLARADRQPTGQLDVHEAVSPAALDQPAQDEAADRAVRMQTVSARMLLRASQKPAALCGPSADIQSSRAEDLLVWAALPRRCRLLSSWMTVAQPEAPVLESLGPERSTK
jgi:hypothetical protein